MMTHSLTKVSAPQIALHLPLPSGWWLLPALVLGTGIWGLLIAALIG